MTLTTILAFTAAMILFAASPGPGLFATTARVMTSGFGAAVYMLVGIVLADLIFLFMAIAGMAAITEAMGGLFIVIKVACGAYLVWLGYVMWRQPPPTPADAAVGRTAGRLRNIFDGLVVGLSNPKCILFYAALLPSFVDLASLQAADIAILAGIVFFSATAVDLTYIVMAARARRLFRAGGGKILQRIGGLTLAGVGITVALER